MYHHLSLADYGGIAARPDLCQNRIVVLGRSKAQLAPSSDRVYEPTAHQVFRPITIRTNRITGSAMQLAVPSVHDNRFKL